MKFVHQQTKDNTERTEEGEDITSEKRESGSKNQGDSECERENGMESKNEDVDENESSEERSDAKDIMRENSDQTMECVDGHCNAAEERQRAMEVIAIPRK